MPKKLTKEEFIERAIKIHGSIYDYSKVKYVNSGTKVCIISPKYGEFWITPRNHLRGMGFTHIHKHTKESFINEAYKLHNGLYDYSLINESNIKGKVPIICRIHGVFYQSKGNHLSGHGCPFCRNESYKQLICGVGVNDLMAEVGTEVYTTWRNMIIRCYDEKRLVKHPTYQGVTVCEDWHRLSVFKKWYDANRIEGYMLDKDIINKGNKIYSPQNCCFVPPEINALFTKRHLHRGEYPIGVSYKNGSYYAAISQNGKIRKIGHFDTPEEAFMSYKHEKEAYIKQLAAKYYSDGKITKRVYDALMMYQVEITD